MNFPTPPTDVTLQSVAAWLLRLYDWRNHVDAGITEQQARAYGTDKKRAWELLRGLL